MPKINKASPIIRWTDVFVEYFNHEIGSRTIPLAYLLQKNEAPRPAVQLYLSNKAGDNNHHISHSDQISSRNTNSSIESLQTMKHFST